LEKLDGKERDTEAPELLQEVKEIWELFGVLSCTRTPGETIKPADALAMFEIARVEADDRTEFFDYIRAMDREFMTLTKTEEN